MGRMDGVTAEAVDEVAAPGSEASFVEVATERLEAEVTTLAFQLAAGECRMLLMVAELDRRGAWAEWGCRSCAHWLNFQCGIDLGAAREKVRVAHRIGELPRVRSEFAAGRLSYSKVRALTRVAAAETEDDLVELALDTSAAQLERILRAYRRALPGEDASEAKDYEGRYLSWHHSETGAVVIEARLPAEAGAAVLAAIEAATVKGGDVSAETSIGQRRADALVAVAEAATAATANERQASVVSNVVVVADVGVLADDDPDGCCHLADGAALAPETARRLACDAAVDLVVQDADGNTLDVGRRTRTIPPGLRRAVLARDRCCVWPGCNEAIINIHHLRHWTKGGRTDLANLAALCRFHHHSVHEGRFTVRRNPDGTITVFHPNGRPIHPPTRHQRTATPPREHVPAGRRGCAPRQPEPRIDLDYVLSVLADAHGRHWN